MMRHHKHIDWAQHLAPVDMRFLAQQIEPNDWYPMETFERMGNAILSEVADNDVELVRAWGWASVEPLRRAFPMLVADGDPIESLARFRVMRATFFDFEAITLASLEGDEARIGIAYQMGARAEEAAAYQTMGFFEGVVQAAGVKSPRAAFSERSWTGDTRTLLVLAW